MHTCTTFFLIWKPAIGYDLILNIILLKRNVYEANWNLHDSTVGFSLGATKQRLALAKRKVLEYYYKLIFVNTEEVNELVNYQIIKCRDINNNYDASKHEKASSFSN